MQPSESDSAFASLETGLQASKSSTISSRRLVIAALGCLAIVGAIVAFVATSSSTSSSDGTSRLQIDNYKAGVCPTIPGYGSCAFSCIKDSDCPDSDKCCFNGCGYSCAAAVPLAVPSTISQLPTAMLGGPNPDGSSPAFTRMLNAPTIMFSSLESNDVNPYDDFKNRFNNNFKDIFVNWANSVGITTSDGERLNIINAAILGFPSSPIPTSGHVTRDFMSQNGGLNFFVSQPMQYQALNPDLVPELVQQVLYKQDSDASALHKMTYSQTFSSTQSLVVTAGISSEIAVEVSVGLPDLGLGSKLSSKITSTLSTSQTSSQTSTDSWGSEEDITIPAHSITNGTCFITAGQLDSAFNGVLTATADSPVGWVFWDDKYNRGDGAWFWFFQTEQTVGGLMNYAASLGSSFNADVQVSGIYRGTAATRVQCEVHSCPYSPNTNFCY